MKSRMAYVFENRRGLKWGHQQSLEMIGILDHAVSIDIGAARHNIEANKTEHAVHSYDAGKG